MTGQELGALGTARNAGVPFAQRTSSRCTACWSTCASILFLHGLRLLHSSPGGKGQAEGARIVLALIVGQNVRRAILTIVAPAFKPRYRMGGRGRPLPLRATACPELVEGAGVRA